MRTRYFPKEEALRIMRLGMIETLIQEGWEREGILIVPVDPFGNGVNGYNCEQGTVEAMQIAGHANE